MSGIMPDWKIAEYAKNGMIEPFVEKQVNMIESTGYGDKDLDKILDTHSHKPVISYGLGSFGYDIRLATEFIVFPPNEPSVMDPKGFIDNATAREVIRPHVLKMPPHSFALGHSVEYFKIPVNVIAISVNKSTYARCGIFCNVTALEPDWMGNLTIELTNMTSFPANVYVNEGIVQLLFFESDVLPLTTYATRNGKYQGDKGVNIAK